MKRDRTLRGLWLRTNHRSSERYSSKFDLERDANRLAFKQRIRADNARPVSERSRIAYVTESRDAPRMIRAVPGMPTRGLVRRSSVWSS